MPIIDGVGLSGHTDDKQRVFAGLLAMHITICSHMNRPYLYVDLNAGPGKKLFDGKEVTGSPIIAVELLDGKLDDYFALLLEERKDLAAELQIQMCALNIPTSRWDVKWIDNKKAVSLLDTMSKQSPMGVIYHDPNGDLDMDLLGLLSRIAGFRQVDILIHLSAANLKRSRKATQSGPDLETALSSVSKKYWLVKEPTGKHQWTFLLGTNWDAFPTWKKEGFYRTNTPRGQDILNRVAFTKRERRDQLQPSLFPEDQ